MTLRFAILMILTLALAAPSTAQAGQCFTTTTPTATVGEYYIGPGAMVHLESNGVAGLQTANDVVLCNGSVMADTRII